jgi:hypothetical protein
LRAPRSGAWDEVDVSQLLGTKWRVLKWLGTESGGVAAIVWEHDVRSPAHALLDVERGTVVPFDAEIAGLSNVEWVVRRDGSIHGFTLTGTVSIDTKGHVVASDRTFVVLASADDRALARDAKGAFWQTTDGGASWVEVAPPPVAGELVDREPLRAASQAGMHCGLVGCTIAHPSEIGSWLRFGWPSDPPARNAASTSHGESIAAGDDAGTSAPPALAKEPPGLPMPKLVCRLKSELKATSEEPAPHAPANEADRVKMLGGRRVAKAPPGHEFVDPAYRDRFDGAVGGFERSSIEHAMRAALYFETGPAHDGRWSPEPAGPVEGFYIETFDPAGRIRHALGSFRSAPAASGAQAAPAGNNAYRELRNHPARPVLGAARPGEAAGVLVSAGDRTLWITPTGRIRETAACPEKLEAFGGVVDAHGKLWIACEAYSRTVEIIDGESGHTRLKLPAVVPWGWQPEPKMPLYGGGRSTFLANPDAIAVRTDGELAVVRLPSEGPATIDDPAWLLTPDAPPVELAPWSALEPATSAACSRPSDAVRLLVQTPVPWITVEGSLGFRRQPGMTAVLRWGRDRICLEALEAGYRELEDPADRQYGVQVMAVARFAGAGAGAGLVGASRSEVYRVPATCKLEPGAAAVPN